VTFLSHASLNNQLVLADIENLRPVESMGVLVQVFVRVRHVDELIQSVEIGRVARLKIIFLLQLLLLMIVAFRHDQVGYQEDGITILI